MTTGLKAQDEAQVAEAVGWAAAESKLLELVGYGSKRGIGRATQTDYTLDLSALAGVRLYEPEELIMTCGAGTSLAEINAQLDAAKQELAFEPPDLSRLLDTEAEGGTIGGILASNFAGPRRIKAGAARDHFLGVSAVSGRGEVFKSGGRVVKNVTGYDICKGLAGSWGTLAAMTEVTVKVLPRAETLTTVVLFGLDTADAVKAMSAAMNSAGDVSGAAYVPDYLTGNLSLDNLAAEDRSITALRLEGIAASVTYRAKALKALLRGMGEIGQLKVRASQAFWRDVRDVVPLADQQERYVWRVSVPPAQAPQVAAEIAHRVSARMMFDWAGGLIWLDVPAQGDAHSTSIRAAISPVGGHATLIRAPAAVRAGVDVFQPQEGALAGLTQRLKSSFDPRGVLNHGRMYAGV